MAQSKFRISFIYASYRGPMIPWIRLGENKNLRMQIRFRKYELDKKIS